MTQILKRALPFVVAFVLGVLMTFVVGRISGKRHTTFVDPYSYRSDCKKRRDSGMRTGMITSGQPVEVWELPDSATVFHTYNWVAHSSSTSLTLKEQALVSRAERSGTNFVVSYVSPEAVDDRGYTQN